MDLSDLQIFQCRGARRQRDARGRTAASRSPTRRGSGSSRRICPSRCSFARASGFTAPAGQVLLGHAERLLALADEARGAVPDARPRAPSARAMEHGGGQAAGLLSEYHRRHPGVVLELRTGNPVVLGSAILAGDLDAALVAEPIAEAPFEKIFAFDEELVIVAPANHPPIGKKGSLPRTVLVFEHGCPHRNARGLVRASADAGAHHRNSRPIMRSWDASWPAWGYR